MTRLNTFAVSVFLLSISARAASAANLTVVVKDVHNAKGYVFIAVYDSDSSFMKGPLAKVARKSKGVKGTVIFVIPNLPAGKYAVTSYHDENDNGKMDKNSLGVPTEGYGFSNDAQDVGGPPKYSQAAFDFDGKTDKTISFSLNY